jgi:hypothetical protein
MARTSNPLEPAAGQELRCGSATIAGGRCRGLAPEPPAASGLAAPAWRLEHQAGAASRHSTVPGGSDGAGTRPTSYLPRRSPSIAVIPRHHLSWGDEMAGDRGESEPQQPGV